MPHLHKEIDFVVAVFIVYKSKVLLVHHKILNEWLPVGGHIELNENPEQTIFREIYEETGLKKQDFTIISNKPKLYGKRFKFLFTPSYLDIHDFSKEHKHINLIYFVKSKKDKVTRNENEHNKIRWFSKNDIDNDIYKILPQIKFLSKKALKLIQQIDN
jgi:8-oxo-dGTP pyrophosphatase MutT (NUDIX family)